MNAKLIALAMGLAAIGAHGKTFSGSGTLILEGKTKVGYTTELTVDVLPGGQGAQFSEVSNMDNGEVHKDSYSLTIGNLGVVTVTRGTQQVGSGYCFMGKGHEKWCDYHVEVPHGTIHNNFYYDADNDSLYRMGDITMNQLTSFWSDALSLSKP